MKGDKYVSGGLDKRVGLVAVAALGLALAALASAAWYRYPAFLARELARVTGKGVFLPPVSAPEARVERSSWPQNAAVLPKSVAPPLVQTNEMMRIDELRQRPPLLIEGATVVFDGTAAARIATSTLTLRNATIVTGGADLEIEVETLVADNSEIRAFLLTDTSPPKGAGRDGGRVRLVVHGRIGGVLRVDLSGQAGARGATGKPGQPGQPGGPGADARAAGGLCQNPAAAGGAGTPGGAGGNGENGAPGGAGGQFTFITRDPAEAGRHVEFTAEGGRGGAGGAGGPGGEGGAGGIGGEPAGACIGQGAPGPRGANGQAGLAGQNGAMGPAGSMRTLTLGEKP
ncbi:MAG: hypothetical protein U1E28_09250 [Beijerinckiaceae bacterium]